MSTTTSSKVAPKPLGRVGRYVLRAELASGGMASVYLADLHGPHGFEKAVAVKRIHAHLAKDRRFVEMFLDEARLAARIHHPNVCAIVDFGEEEGAPYLVMEYLSGLPLSTVMNALRAIDSTPYWLPARLVHDAALGLHAAHRLRDADGELVGLVHRDVSPQNIFVLFDGNTKVVDFGVASARGRITTTRTNEIKGKLGYMSPEQFNQERLDQRTDVWALGVVLWEATVGSRLFRGDNDGATLNLVLHRPIPRPSESWEEYPERLEQIVMRCLERDRELRYPNAEALAADLEEYLYSTGKPAGVSQVQKWMETQFGAHIEAQEALLRSGAGPAPAIPPGGAPSFTQSALRMRPDAADEEPPTRFRSEARKAPLEPAPAREAPSRWKPLAWMAGGAALVLAGVFALGPRGERAPAPVVAAPPAPAAPVAEPAPLALEATAIAEPVAEPAPLALEATAIAEPVAEPAAEPAPDDAVAAAEPELDEAAAPAGRRARRGREPRSRRVEAPREAAAPAGSAADGRLSLIAIPAARVRLRGRSLGITPLVNVSLPAGAHRLELRGDDGRTKSVTVRITGGETTRLRVEL